MHINLLWFGFLQIGCLLLLLVMAIQQNKMLNIKLAVCKGVYARCSPLLYYVVIYLLLNKILFINY